MPRNGTGTYIIPSAAGNPVIPNTPIVASWANPTLADIAAALTQSVSSDGQTAMTGSLNMANNKIVNLAAGVNPLDAVNFSQYSTGAGATGTWNINITGSSQGFAGVALVPSGGTGLTQVPTGQILFGPSNTPAVGTMLGTNLNLFWDNTNNRFGLGTQFPNALLDVRGSSAIMQTFEAVQVDSTTVPNGLYNFNFLNGAVVYLTQAPTGNVTLNLRGNATNAFSFISPNLYAATFAFCLNNGGTPFFVNQFQIDGANVSVRWAGGGSPAAGNANSTDVYTFTVIDLGATYAVIANLTQYA